MSDKVWAPLREPRGDALTSRRMPRFEKKNILTITSYSTYTAPSVQRLTPQPISRWNPSLKKDVPVINSHDPSTYRGIFRKSAQKKTIDYDKTPHPTWSEKYMKDPTTAAAIEGYSRKFPVLNRTTKIASRDIPNYLPLPPSPYAHPPMIVTETPDGYFWDASRVLFEKRKWQTEDGEQDPLQYLRHSATDHQMDFFCSLSSTLVPCTLSNYGYKTDDDPVYFITGFPYFLPQHSFLRFYDLPPGVQEHISSYHSDKYKPILNRNGRLVPRSHPDGEIPLPFGTYQGGRLYAHGVVPTAPLTAVNFLTVNYLQQYCPTFHTTEPFIYKEKSLDPPRRVLIRPHYHEKFHWWLRPFATIRTEDPELARRIVSKQEIYLQHGVPLGRTLIPSHQVVKRLSKPFVDGTPHPLASSESLPELDPLPSHPPLRLDRDNRDNAVKVLKLLSKFRHTWEFGEYFDFSRIDHVTRLLEKVENYFNVVLRNQVGHLPQAHSILARRMLNWTARKNKPYRALFCKIGALYGSQTFDLLYTIHRMQPYKTKLNEWIVQKQGRFSDSWSTIAAAYHTTVGNAYGALGWALEYLGRGVGYGIASAASENPLISSIRTAWQSFQKHACSVLSSSFKFGLLSTSVLEVGFSLLVAVLSLIVFIWFFRWLSGLSSPAVFTAALAGIVGIHLLQIAYLVVGMNEMEPTTVADEPILPSADRFVQELRKLQGNTFRDTWTGTGEVIDDRDEPPLVRTTWPKHTPMPPPETDDTPPSGPPPSPPTPAVRAALSEALESVVTEEDIHAAKQAGGVTLGMIVDKIAKIANPKGPATAMDYLDLIPRFSRIGHGLEWFATKMPKLGIALYGKLTGKVMPMSAAEEKVLEMHRTYEGLKQLKLQFGTWLGVSINHPDRIPEITRFFEEVKAFDRYVYQDKMAQSAVERMYKEVLSAGIEYLSSLEKFKHLKGGRRVPIWLNLHGPPGKGKSNFAYEIFRWIRHFHYANFENDKRYFNDPADPDFYTVYQMLFPFPAGEQYFDGYHDQPFLFMDEIFSKKDSAERSVTGALLLQLISDVPVTLLVADMTRKDTQPRIDYFISTSNEDSWIDTGLASEEALHSRILLNVFCDLDHDNKFTACVIPRPTKNKLKMDPTYLEMERTLDAAAIAKIVTDLYKQAPLPGNMPIDFSSFSSFDYKLTHPRFGIISSEAGNVTVTRNHAKPPKTEKTWLQEQFDGLGVTFLPEPAEAVKQGKSETRQEVIDLCTEVYEAYRYTWNALGYQRPHVQLIVDKFAPLFPQCEDAKPPAIASALAEFARLHATPEGSLVAKRLAAFFDKQPEIRAHIVRRMWSSDAPADKAARWLIDNEKPATTAPIATQTDPPKGRSFLQSAMIFIGSLAIVVGLFVVIFKAVCLIVRNFFPIRPEEELQDEIQPQSGDPRTARSARTAPRMRPVRGSMNVVNRVSGSTATKQSIPAEVLKISHNVVRANFNGVDSHVLFLRGNLAVTNTHNLARMVEGTSVELFSDKLGPGYFVPVEDIQLLNISDIEVNSMEDYCAHEAKVPLVFLGFPLMTFFPDITGFFRNEFTPDTPVYRVNRDVQFKEVAGRTTSNVHTMPHYSEHVKYGPTGTHHTDILVTGMPNQLGDCGLPYITTGAQSTIIGIHQAGNPQQKLCYAITITKNMVDAAWDLWKSTETAVATLQSRIGSGDLATREEFQQFVPGTTPLGKLTTGSVHIPVKSRLRETPLHPDQPDLHDSEGPITLDFLPTRKPAKLSFTTSDGRQVPNLAMPLAKYHTVGGFPNTLSLSVEESHVHDIDYSKFVYPGFNLTSAVDLSLHEAVFGRPGQHSSVDWSKSPGFPGVLHAHSRRIDQALGPDGKLRDDFKQKVLQVYHDWETATDESIVIDTTKDELLDIEDSDAGKLRIFSIMEFHRVVATRMVFDSVIKHVTAQPSQTTCAIGINPHDNSWTILGNRLARNSDNAILGDFKGHEFTLPVHWVTYGFPLFLDTIAPTDPVTRKRRFNCMASVIYPIHIVGSQLMRSMRKGASGHGLTAFMAWFISLMFHVSAWLDEGNHTLEEFFIFVILSIMGDDSVGTVHDKYPWYNMQYLEKYARKVGMVYTSNVKKGVSVPYMSLKDPSALFLKRRFVLTTNKYGTFYTAPLKKSSIMEALMWQDKSATSDDKLNTMRSVLIEMRHYGDEEYSRMHHTLVRYCRALGLHPDFPPPRQAMYQFWQELRYSSELKYDENATPLYYGLSPNLSEQGGE